MKSSRTLFVMVTTLYACVAEGEYIYNPPIQGECLTNWCEIVQGPSGSLSYTGVYVWPGTNMCLGSEIWAWPEADQRCSEVVTISKWAPESTNCPPVLYTNSACPEFITNWWVVTHPGYSGSGSGTWVYFVPTNCGSGTITFFGIWRERNPCTGEFVAGGTISITQPFTVVNVDIFEAEKTVCVCDSTAFTLTNTCWEVSWEVWPEEAGGGSRERFDHYRGNQLWSVGDHCTINCQYKLHGCSYLDCCEGCLAGAQ